MLLPVEIARFNRPQRRLVSVALILASRRTAVSCYGALRSPDFPPADCSADDRLEKFRSQGMHSTRFIAAFQARTDFHPHRPLPRNFDYPLAITIGFIYIFVYLPRSPAKQGCKRQPNKPIFITGEKTSQAFVPLPFCPSSSITPFRTCFQAAFLALTFFSSSRAT